MFKAIHGRLSDSLVSRLKMIMVTSLCESRCGGCSSFCPNLHPDQHFVIDIPDLRDAIEVHRGWDDCIGIYGGEPLRHPQWEEILRVLYSYPEFRFEVFTGYDEYEPKHNVVYTVDPKDCRDPECTRDYYPQLIAPLDVFREPRKMWYVEKAFAECSVWLECHTVIYDRKAFFCENAGMMDRLFGEDGGWPVEPGKYPYVRTDKEIAQQAMQYCYRCGCNYTSEDLESHQVPWQYISQKSMASRTCRRFMRKPMRNVVPWDPET